VGGGGLEIERENTRLTVRERERERERKIGVETRIERMGDTAGERGTKKGYGTEMQNCRQPETLHSVNTVSFNTAEFNNVLLNKNLRNQVSMR